MKITVITNDGNITSNISQIDLLENEKYIRAWNGDAWENIYRGENTKAVMNHIRSVLLAADYSCRDSILINLNSFDERGESNKPIDDTIKHGDLIRFNGREAYVIDLKNELYPTEDFPLFTYDDGALILDKDTFKPIDMYSNIDHLNRDFQEYKVNKIIKL